MRNRLETWIAFLDIDSDTIRTLQEFVPVIESHIDGILDEFYALLLQTEAAALFASPESMQRARQAQKTHWLTQVLAGKFDQDFMATAQKIGESHYRNSVDLMNYSSAYAVVLDKLSKLITTLHHEQPEVSYRILRAVNKAVFFDMGLAVAVYHDAFTDSIEEMSLELNSSLARAGEFRDNETGYHLQRMSRMCRILASAIGKDTKWTQMILVASPLHDVGKIGIPDQILLKPGKLDAREWEVMRNHTEIGAKIIPDNATDVIRMARRISLTHHERWDGTGYPAGLKGVEIPLEGRIAAICDVYDALRSARPYKQPWTADQAMTYLNENSGFHFDPDLVTVFRAIQPDMEDIQTRYADSARKNHDISDDEIVPSS